MTGRVAVVRRPGDGRIIPLGIVGNVLLKVAGIDSGGSLTAYEFTLGPGMAGPPLHIHHTWDEMFYVLDGEVTFTLDGVEAAAPKGTCVFVPHGCEHTFWNAGTEPARQLTILTPSGIEDYFDEVTQALTTGGNESIDEAIAMMERYDMTISRRDAPAYGLMEPNSE